MVKILWLVRHSIREDLEKSSTTTSDCSITNDGVDLAVKTGEEICKMTKILPITTLYTSPYLRAIQTTMAISTQITAPIQLCPHLSEFVYLDSNTSEPMNPNLIPSKPLKTYLKGSNIDFPETEDHFNQRVAEFLDSFKYPFLKDQNILAVTHGSVFNAIVKHIWPEYIYNQFGTPDKYIPGYCDYIGISWDILNSKWELIHSSWDLKINKDKNKKLSAL